ncbi:MAG TPA: CoB--CoM heterodisulfide reductase iron-sulfur subunit B family protein [Anaerolineales bacterium]|nr:CoB--CoM heterodisulfide reductase iron-sulfur subunit B family protein [Anaerolineales bacterium]HLF01765.1 CoB--CoM heterodisulfide reductase iron-sulfur subunit B family protein [Anaerolineales bacterium]
MTRYLLYPGCSMESSARAYSDSLMAICEPLGLDLDEIRDWNCCGATEYLGISLTPAYALISRNLALAAQQANGTQTVVAPCSACYLNLAKADYYMRERPVLGERVNTALAAGGLHYQAGSLTIRHLLDVIINDIGLETVKQKVTRPLKGLRVAPYLGCMVPRPDYEKRWSNPEYPNELDRLLTALGAEVIDFPLKTHCCGGHMPHISPETAFELIRRLISAADQYKADLMVTLCPMCQLNIDAYQGEMNAHFRTEYRMPILFFTQLMGLAFGKGPKELGIGKELVNARSALAKIGVESPPAEQGGPPRKKKAEGLPMPRMPHQEEVAP